MSLWQRLRPLLVLPLMAGLAFGCATYQKELNLAVAHYQNNQYDKALALLEILNSDVNSLSKSERAQYAYYRGMANFRLERRVDARHWLGRAAALDKLFPGSLSPEEKKRVAEKLTDLNRDRFGGAQTAANAKTCTLDSQCAQGQFCDGGSCASSAATTSAPPAASPAKPGQ